MPIITRWIPALNDTLADNLAAELGDRPLAAAQVAGYPERTGMPASDCLGRFLTWRAELLTRGKVLSYHGRIDTTRAHSTGPVQQPARQPDERCAPPPPPTRLRAWLLQVYRDLIALRRKNSSLTDPWLGGNAHSGR